MPHGLRMWAALGIVLGATMGKVHTDSEVVCLSPHVAVTAPLLVEGLQHLHHTLAYIGPGLLFTLRPCCPTYVPSLKTRPAALNLPNAASL